jgi:hypothetical protein
VRTNDPNEPAVALEVGGDGVPAFDASPPEAALLLDRADGPDGTVAWVVVSSRLAPQFRVSQVRPSVDWLDCSFSMHEETVTRSFAELLGGTRRLTRCRVGIRLIPDRVPDGNGVHTASVVLATDASVPEFAIPVCAEVLGVVHPVPDRLFFGTISGRAAKQVRIVSRQGGIRHVKATCLDPHLSLSVTLPGKESDCVELVATLDPAGERGVMSGEIRVDTVVGEAHHECVMVPYSALFP